VPPTAVSATSAYPIYAVGDVHGRDDLLAELHERIAQYHYLMHGAAAATLVHVGDYIDRGPDSIAVIDRLMRPLPGIQWICLKGNHEQMMLNCIASNNRQVWSNWLGNGGEATLRSLGLSMRFGGADPGALAAALGEERIAWLRALPLWHRAGGYLFVHAGIAPGLPLEAQEEYDLLWIRGRFLDSDVDHGFRVVHGHTPTDAPVVRTNRIGIDTGAGSGGPLTAAALVEARGPRFLVAKSAPDLANTSHEPTE